jgi:hypothetical protein
LPAEIGQGRPKREKIPGMTSWRDFEQAEPQFAQRVQGLFAGRRHHTLATLRADGSPRISGIEVTFGEDGELGFGSMPNARKGMDLRRDPRCALHSATTDPVEGAAAAWPGEAKISARAVAVTVGTDGGAADGTDEGAADGTDEGAADGTGGGAANGTDGAAAAGDRFRLDIADVVHTHLNEQATLLVVEWWTPAHGLRRIERE